MVNICMYFQVHQPFRLRHYTVFDIGVNTSYFDEEKNKYIFQKIANNCYLPANKILLNLIKESKQKIKISFSISATALEQFNMYAPEVLKSYQALYKTGCVEFLAETSHHSLAFLYSPKEFEEQIQLHERALKKYLKVDKPTVFRNTELIYNNALALHIERLGYKGILCEGADQILSWDSPNTLFYATDTSLPVLCKNYKLSDDIAFRFSNKAWDEYPLTAEKFVSLLDSQKGEVVNLFMDYETFGEHHDESILTFLKQFPLLALKKHTFVTPSEVAAKKPTKELDVKEFISWADNERDLSAWRGNKMQLNALQELYAIEKQVRATKDKILLEEWRKVQTSDHFYYMSTKMLKDGQVHTYFNPFGSPYDAFIAYMNVLNDIIIRSSKHKKTTVRKKGVQKKLSDH